MSNHHSQQRLALYFCLVVAVIALITTNQMKSPSPTASISIWNVYQGEVPILDTVYKVDISESDHNQHIGRIVHLETEGVTPLYTSITGHDYDSDNVWDRVFYCGNHDLIDTPPVGTSAWGCNSVLMTKKGWRFEACPADEGKIKPFSPKAIEFAISELDRAMREVHDLEHMTKHHLRDRNADRTILDQNRRL